MNHQIDTQIANARLMRLPSHKEAVSRRRTWCARPSPTTRIAARASASACSVQVKGDFLFQGSHALFLQVIDNLMKNALRSLAAASAASQPGDLTIEVGTQPAPRPHRLTDRGVGIDPELQARIFEPFFSTDRGTGHGLGLAFCQRVVHGANGSIRVKSEPGRGASFTIELPVLGLAQ